MRGKSRNAQTSGSDFMCPMCARVTRDRVVAVNQKAKWDHFLSCV